jgi:hypothetical protein
LTDVCAETGIREGTMAMENRIGKAFDGCVSGCPLINSSLFVMNNLLYAAGDPGRFNMFTPNRPIRL